MSAAEFPIVRRPWSGAARVVGIGATVLFVVLFGAVGLLVWLIPASQPVVERTEGMAQEDVEKALQLARAHDPRRAIPGVVRTLRLSQHEAELLLNHAAARVRPSRWALRVDAVRASLRGSIRLPDNPFGPWLNVSLHARQTRGLPQLESMQLGRLPVPVFLVEWAVDRVAARYGLGSYRTMAAVSVQEVRLANQRLEVVYAWGTDAPSRVLAAMLPAQEHERLRLYASRLADVTARLPPRVPVSLSELLPPMFELARGRTAEGHDAALENRAALLVLGMVANGVSLGTLLPERRADFEARPIRLTLAGRRDFPQHLLMSAALAADSGGSFADLVGLYKELSDARSGSGFSFNDVAANRAGTRLGELAVGSPLKLQQRLTANVHEEDLMPDVSDLPEYMNEGEFRRRYGAPGSPEYQRMMNDIEGRLGATPLFRPGP